MKLETKIEVLQEQWERQLNELAFEEATKKLPSPDLIAKIHSLSAPLHTNYSQIMRDEKYDLIKRNVLEMDRLNATEIVNKLANFLQKVKYKQSGLEAYFTKQQYKNLLSMIGYYEKMRFFGAGIPHYDMMIDQMKTTKKGGDFAPWNYDIFNGTGGDYHKQFIEKYRDFFKYFSKKAKEKYKFGKWEILIATKPTKEYIQSVEEALVKTEKILNKQGFGFLVGGLVIIKNIKGASWSAKYYHDNDSIVFNVGLQYSERFTEYDILIHELGHRYWFKIMNEKERGEYWEHWKGNNTFVDFYENNAKGHLFNIFLIPFINVTDSLRFLDDKTLPTLTKRMGTSLDLIKQMKQHFPSDIFDKKQWESLIDKYWSDHLGAISTVIQDYGLPGIKYSPSIRGWNKEIAKIWLKEMKKWKLKDGKIDGKKVNDFLDDLEKAWKKDVGEKYQYLS